ncbi:hypothetical protein ACHAXN_010721 [Cyclotella atomus]
MDEFDFDTSPSPPPASSPLSYASAPALSSTAESFSPASSQKRDSEPPSPLSSSASPPRGRTKARRSRKVIRTGADALALANAKLDSLSSTDGQLLQSNSQKSGARKRSLKETPDSSNGLDSTVGACKHPNETYLEAETPHYSNKNAMSSDHSNKSNSTDGDRKCYGRRRKKHKSSTASHNSIDDWDGTDDFKMKMDNTPPSNCVVDRILTKAKSSNKQPESGIIIHNDGMEMGTPPTPATPPTLKSGSHRSVRFSLSSNTQHYYQGYGTPPSTLQSNESADLYGVDEDRVEIHSSQGSKDESTFRSKEFDDKQSLDERSNSKASAVPRNNQEVNDSKQSLSGGMPDYGSEEESAFVLTEKDKPKSAISALQGCLKSLTRQPIQRKRNSTDSPSPTKSDHSASSYGSFGVRNRRKHRSRFNGSYTTANTSYSQQQSQESEDGMYQSNSPETVVALGRRDDIQDVGNYRMMIDDLSYLCSAILGCRKRSRQQVKVGDVQQITKHDSVTAGAACDLAETISQSEMQTALLVLGGQKNNVGALTAVLEAVACAPSAVDWMEVCANIVEGRVERLKGSVSTDNGANGHSKMDSNKPVFGGRTKSARRKQSVPEPNNKSDPIPSTNVVTRDKYGGISSKALALVVHFISTICTAKSTNPSISKAAIKSARNAVLAHKASLQGIARLVLDDPVVDAYLRHVIQDRANIDNTVEEEVDDQSVFSCATAGSKRSTISAASNEQFNDVQGSDPTKFGRRKGRKKKPSRLQQAIDSSDLGSNQLEPIAEIDDDSSLSSEKTPQTEEKLVPGSNGKSDSLSFASDDASRVSKDHSVKNGSNDNVEFSGSSSARFQEKISSALSRANLNHSLEQAILASDLNSSQGGEEWTCSYCSAWEQNVLNASNAESSSRAPLTAASLALDSAGRIISGRVKNACGFDDEDHSDEDESDDNFFQTDESNDFTKNPILVVNEMMRKSDSLPSYSRSLATTISSMLILLRDHGSDCEEARHQKCNRCIAYLQHRASTLSEIIDNLCCLSPASSKALSLPETLLIPSLLQVVFESHGVAQSSFREALIMTALKTLTTLTHENSSACDQIKSFVQPAGGNAKLINGVEIVFRHLFATIEEAPHQKSYDAIIFCLNILTNVAEMIPSYTRDIFVDMNARAGLNGITWLTRWIVTKTTGFQRAIMKGSFGSTAQIDVVSSEHEELQSGEEGNLVTAGNGFVLLAYLMLDEDNSTVTARIRDIIIEELPVDKSGKSGGIQFMIKTLKAFCNFYHYSVGDLSVAVIAPVIKLIAGLERIHLVQQSSSWL